MKDLKEYAESQITEALHYEFKGLETVSDVVAFIEQMETDFDGDSFCPYYSDQDDVISRYESDFGQEAEDMIDSSEKYSAADWQKAKTEYAYAIAYAGFSNYFETVKRELIEELDSFESDAAGELDYDGEIKVQVSMDCIHGWASHDSETADGLHVWKSGQLDGCNGAAIKTACGIWISCCVDPKQSEAA